jgi:hypothetical protein
MLRVSFDELFPHLRRSGDFQDHFFGAGFLVCIKDGGKKSSFLVQQPQQVS